jgi:hypothetical protein
MKLPKDLKNVFKLRIENCIKTYGCYCNRMDAK